MTWLRVQIVRNSAAREEQGARHCRASMSRCKRRTVFIKSPSTVPGLDRQLEEVRGPARWRIPVRPMPPPCSSSFELQVRRMKHFDDLAFVNTESNRNSLRILSVFREDAKHGNLSPLCFSVDTSARRPHACCRKPLRCILHLPVAIVILHAKPVEPLMSI